MDYVLLGLAVGILFAVVFGHRYLRRSHRSDMRTLGSKRGGDESYTSIYSDEPPAPLTQEEQESYQTLIKSKVWLLAPYPRRGARGGESTSSYESGNSIFSSARRAITRITREADDNSSNGYNSIHSDSKVNYSHTNGNDDNNDEHNQNHNDNNNSNAYKRQGRKGRGRSNAVNVDETPSRRNDYNDDHDDNDDIPSFQGFEDTIEPMDDGNESDDRGSGAADSIHRSPKPRHQRKWTHTFSSGRRVMREPRIHRKPSSEVSMLNFLQE